MKQLVIGFVLGLAAALSIWSFSGEDAQARPALPGDDGGAAGSTCGCVGDLNGDNVVNVFDLLDLLANWGACAPVPPDCCENDCDCDTTDACTTGTCEFGLCLYMTPDGALDCNGVCVDIEFNNNHCGGCNIMCPPNTNCEFGECILTCTGGLSECDGQCVNLGTDPNNCGSCDTPCDVGETCADGRCVLSQCMNDIDCDDGLPCSFNQCIDGVCVEGFVASGVQCLPSEPCKFGLCTGDSPHCQIFLVKDGTLCGPNDEQCLFGECVVTQTWYEDLDGDGFGNCTVFVQAPEPPPGYVSICGDCDDTDPTIFPGAPMICDDGVDNNCNGLVDCDDPECSSQPSCW